MNDGIQVAASFSAFSVLFIFAGALLFWRRRQEVRRLQQYVASHSGPRNGDNPDDAKRVEDQSQMAVNLNRRLGSSSIAQQLQLQLARSGLTMTASQFILGQVGLGAILFLIGRFVLFPSQGVLSLPMSLGLTIPAVILPRFVLKFLQNRRVVRFENQLAQTVDVMAGALQAGSSLPQSFEMVAREMPDPIGEEFNRLVQEAAFAVPLDQALRNMVVRIPSLDLEMLVTAINIQYRVGGNLSHILKTIAHTIRERVRLRGVLSTLTAQARLSSYIISGMPVVVVMALFVISPAYIIKLFDPGITRIMLIAGIMGIVSGFYVMKRISAIEVYAVKLLSIYQSDAFRRALVALFVLLGLLAGTGLARAEGLEITDLRTDNYPRVVLHFTANAEDGSPLNALRPGQIKIIENGVEQDKVDFYSLRDTSPELWVVMVVDVSGSMNDDDKLNQARTAAKAFVTRLRPKDRTAIVTFSDKVLLQQQPTGDLGILGRALDALLAKGPTRMNDGLARGVDEVMRAREGAQRAIILLSDGEDTDSQTELATALAPAIKAKVPIYTVGLGPDVKTDVLQGIADQTKGRYYAAPRASDLDYVFKLLSGQLSSQYELWWPSATVLPAGTTVNGRLAIEGADLPTLQSDFSYTMPVLIRSRTERAEVFVGGADLQEVDLTTAPVWELPSWWPLAAAGLAALGVYAAYYGLVLRLTRTRLQDRLGHFVGTQLAPKSRLVMQRGAAPPQSMRTVVLNLARFSHRLTPTHALDQLRHRLVLAGRPSGWQYSQFLAAKIFLSLGLGLVAYAFCTATSKDLGSYLVFVSSLTALGYYLPHPWLGAQVRNRQKKISRALPDALDLLTVGVGAGLSFDGAVLEVVERADASNALAHELTNFLAELRMGRSRREALQGLDARTEVDDVKVLIASLIQAEELGMALSETLMVQADQMRLRRSQRAEELAHKATLKMMFPMIMLIFPALFVVIMGPAVPGMLSYLGTTGGG